MHQIVDVQYTLIIPVVIYEAESSTLSEPDNKLLGVFENTPENTIFL